MNITNDGARIVATDYWESAAAKAGKVICSPNAGEIRCLLPRPLWPAINELRAATSVVLSRGPWPDAGLPDATEILWDDGSDSPHAWHLSPESWLLLPAEAPGGWEWTISLWTQRKGRPHQALRRVCHWRRVDRIPFMRAWRG